MTDNRVNHLLVINSERETKHRVLFSFETSRFKSQFNLIFIFRESDVTLQHVISTWKVFIRRENEREKYRHCSNKTRFKNSLNTIKKIIKTSFRQSKTLRCKNFLLQ